MMSGTLQGPANSPLFVTTARRVNQPKGRVDYTLKLEASPFAALPTEIELPVRRRPSDSLDDLGLDPFFARTVGLMLGYDGIEEIEISVTDGNFAVTLKTNSFRFKFGELIAIVLDQEATIGVADGVTVRITMSNGYFTLLDQVYDLLEEGTEDEREAKAEGLVLAALASAVNSHLALPLE